MSLVSPLNPGAKIVNPDGTPSAHFVRWIEGQRTLQNNEISISKAQFYDGRANFVADISRGVPFNTGAVIFAGGVGYRLDGGSRISDLSGWSPLGDWEPQHFGAVGDGTTDDNDAIEAWITGCLAEQRAMVAKTGTFKMGSGLSKSVAQDIHVVIASDARFVSGDIAVPCIEFNCTTPRRYRFTFEGGDFDTSEATFNAAVQSGTALAFVRFNDGYVKNLKVYSAQNEGENWASWRLSGDSGITCVDVWNMQFENCLFEGMADSGIYPGGNSNTGSTTDDGGYCIFTSCWFVECWGGLSIKRQMQKCEVIGCFFIDCYSAMSVLEVSNQYPGREITISNCVFHRSGSRAIEIMGYGDTVRITDCQFFDWGYDRDGTTKTGPQVAIRLIGVENAIVRGNHFEFEDWTEDAHIAIQFERYSAWDGTTHDCMNNSIDGNTAVGITTFLKEKDANQGPNHGDDNNLIDVTTPFDSTHANSWIGFTDNVAPQQKKYIGVELRLLGGGAIFGSGDLLNAFVDRAAFTPVLADASTGGNTATFSSSSGRYSRIGSMVKVDIALNNVDTTGMTGANDIYIRGLPVNMDVNSYVGAGTVFTDTVTWTTPPVIWPSTGDFFRLRENDGGFLTVSAISSGSSDFRISFWYDAA